MQDEDISNYGWTLSLASESEDRLLWQVEFLLSEPLWLITCEMFKADKTK